MDTIPLLGDGVESIFPHLSLNQSSKIELIWSVDKALELFVVLIEDVRELDWDTSKGST